MYFKNHYHLLISTSIVSLQIKAKMFKWSTWPKLSECSQPLDCIPFICQSAFLSFWVFLSFSVSHSSSPREKLWLVQAAGTWCDLEYLKVTGELVSLNESLLVRCWLLAQSVVPKLVGDLTLPNAPLSEATVPSSFSVSIGLFQKVSRAISPPSRVCAHCASLPGKLFSLVPIYLTPVHLYISVVSPLWVRLPHPSIYIKFFVFYENTLYFSFITLVWLFV